MNDPEEEVVKYTLVSNDGLECRISPKAFVLSVTFHEMIGNTDCDPVKMGPLPLANIDGKTLPRVVEWCEKHKDDETEELDGENEETSERIPAWDKQFLDRMSNDELYEIVCAANYLHIKKLLLYCAIRVAELGKNKSLVDMVTFYGYKVTASTDPPANPFL